MIAGDTIDALVEAAFRVATGPTVNAYRNPWAGTKTIYRDDLLTLLEILASPDVLNFTARARVLERIEACRKARVDVEAYRESERRRVAGQ